MDIWDNAEGNRGEGFWGLLFLSPPLPFSGNGASSTSELVVVASNIEAEYWSVLFLSPFPSGNGAPSTGKT